MGVQNTLDIGPANCSLFLLVSYPSGFLDLRVFLLFYYTSHKLSQCLVTQVCKYQDDLDGILTPSHAVTQSWEARGFVRTQMADRHPAEGLGLPNRIGRMALIHSFVFLPQRVDLHGTAKPLPYLVLVIPLSTYSFSKYVELTLFPFLP